MIHTGMIEQEKLTTLIQYVEVHKKTGRLTLLRDEDSAEVYLFHGQMVAIALNHAEDTLVRRLLHSGLVSLDELQTVPPAIGRVISQLQDGGQSNDAKIAKILIKLNIMSQEQLVQWIRQDAEATWQQLLTSPMSNVYFEDEVQPPIDHLCTFLVESIAASERNRKNEPEDVFMSAEIFAPPTPTPLDLEYLRATTEAEKYATLVFKSVSNIKPQKQKSREISVVPITPSGFAQLPKRSILPTHPSVQRVVASVLIHTFPNYDPTARVATPPRRNPLLRWETLVIVAVLLIAGLAHGINMFHYPYFEDDEGTYLSQAWAVFHLGRLAYYTYWYDHAPAGWIQIAIWSAITGGFHTFGQSINSGRIFMFLLQLGSTFMLYRITRLLSCSTLIAIIVTLLFALSPYGLYYHRRILLDNIMTFWMLLSILSLISPKVSLKHIWFSGVALAVSILSKEVTVFIIPALAYLVWIRSDKLHRVIAIVGWFTIVFVILSAYPLFAVTKGELFPTGTLLGGSNPHVSLIGTVFYQGSRGKDGGLFSLKSMFWYRTLIWIQDDPLNVVGGSVCAILTTPLIFIKKYRLIATMGLTTLLLWAFTARGGVVLDFYLIPLIPMLALNFGLTLGIIAECLQKGLNRFRFVRKQTIFKHLVRPIFLLLCLTVLIAQLPSPSAGVGYGASNVGSKDDPLIYWNGTQADAQSEAVTWIEHHVSSNSRIIIDMYMWPDLYTAGYHNVHYYWKLETDPAIQMGIFHNDWRNVDYIVTTPQMLLDMQNAHMTLVLDLIQNSVTVAAFDTGKWPVDIRKVHK